MPIYEYNCKGCQRDFEKLVGATADSPSASGVTCPHCGGGELERKLSVFAAVGESAGETAACGLPAGPGCGTCGDPYGPCGN